MRRLLLLLVLGCRPVSPLADTAPRRARPVPTTAPTDALSWSGHAAYAHAIGADDEAERAWAWVGRTDATSPWAWLAVARAARDRGDTTSAWQAADRATSLAPALPQVQLLRARLLLDDCERHAALPLFLAAAKAGLHEAWADALGPNDTCPPADDRDGWLAWWDAELPVAFVRERLAASVARFGPSAARDAGWLMVHDVATPELLALWAAHDAEAARAWVTARGGGWSGRWAEVVATLEGP